MARIYLLVREKPASKYVLLDIHTLCLTLISGSYLSMVDQMEEGMLHVRGYVRLC